MKGQMCLFLTVMLSSCLGRNLDCPQRIKSCEEIKFGDGFRYSHECQDGTLILVDQNEITIAQYRPGSPPMYLNMSMKLDKTSFFTKNCTDLRIKCTVPSGPLVKDVCSSYKISAKLMTNDSSENVSTDVPKDSKLGPIIGGSVAGVVLLLVLFPGIIWLCWRYNIYAWLKKNHDATARAKTDSGLDDDDSMITLNEIHPAIGQHATDQNEINSMLESVRVQSDDPQADGETPETLSLDNIYDGTKPSKGGGVDVPDGACNLRSMHRGLRDDPGGVTDSKVEDSVGIRDMQNGRPLVDRGREKDENERAQLLPIQGDSIQRSDMRGEAAALVDTSCYDPDQISRCSPAPDDDVKSASMKKCGVHKY